MANRRYSLINKPVNATGAVTSFNTRAGAVVPASGDYDAFYYTESEVDSLISGFLSNVVEDTTPQLGGDLDMNGFAITNRLRLSGSNYEVDPTDFLIGMYNATEGYIQIPGATGSVSIWNGATGRIANFDDNGITTLYGTLAGTSAGFSGALTALSYGGITEANLLDKSATETITGAWDFQTDGTKLPGATYHNTYFGGDQVYYHYYNGSPAAPTYANLRVSDGAGGYNTLIIGGNAAMSFDGTFSATAIGGIAEANLLDKTATEGISGQWTHTGDVIIDVGRSLTFWNTGQTASAALVHSGSALSLNEDMAITGALTATSYGGITEANLVDKSATETISGDWNFTGTGLLLSGHLYHNLFDGVNQYTHYYTGAPAGDTFANMRVYDSGGVTFKTLRFGGDGSFTWDGTAVSLSGHTHVIADVTDFTDNSTNWDTAYGWGDHSGLYSLAAHTHSGVYEPADATILKDADIGVTVQAYDATYLVDADIGGSVQAYDADTAKTDVAESISALWGFDANLRVRGSVPSIYTEFARGTSELQVTPSGAGNGFWLTTGTEFRVYDNTNADYLQIEHDGTDANISGVTTADINITGITNVNLNGNPLLTSVAVSDLDNGTDGELITWSAAGAPTTVAVGTAGHVLTSNGAGAAPTFQAAAGGGGATLYYKAADETITSSSTLQDDNDFTGIALDADSWYKITMFLDCQSNGTADLKFQWAFTNTPQDGNWACSLISTGGAYSGDTANAATGFLSLFFSGTVMDGTMTGFVRSNASTGGTMKLQWAQITSDAFSTGLRAGCWLAIEKLS